MKMKNFKKALLLLLALCLMLSGCGEKKEEANAGSTDIDLSSYPIETDVTLTYFRAMPSNAATLVDNYGETNYAKEFEKRTGVKIEYMHPGAGAIKEALNLMVASDELPDIVEYAWISDYVGGPSKAINDEVIVSLNDYKEYAPAFFFRLAENKEYDKAAKTDNGDYYGFPMIQESLKLAVTNGPVVRGDWLEELGLDAPKTLEDWEEMLTAFKEKKNAKAPFSFNYGVPNAFFALLNCSRDAYIKDGKVVYGAVQEEFKEALALARKWFEKGLLDNNIASVDSKLVGSQLLSGVTGATFLSGGSGIGPYLQSGQAENPKFDLLAVPFPSAKDGEVNTWMPASSPISGAATAAITTKCKYPQLAAKVLDYVFTEEGYILSNFGIEGKTFTMVDGVPTYTELITNNPDGLTFSQALGMNVKAGASSSGVVSENYINQYYALPQQRAALDVWPVGAEKAIAKKLPGVTPKDEELTEYAGIMNEVQKYRDQMVIKFITGIEPLSKFDEYVERMNGYGLPRAMEIQTAALKRYNAR